jgi:hypothetical protein
MAMSADLPIVQATARGDGLAVQQVGRRPVGAVSIELEDGNGRMGVAASSPVFLLCANRTEFMKVQYPHGFVHYRRVVAGTPLERLDRVRQAVALDNNK